DLPLDDPPADALAAALIEGIRDQGLHLLPWGKGARRLRARIGFAARAEPEGGWPDMAEAALLAGLEAWLAPHLAGISELDGLERLDLAGALAGLLSWPQRQALDRLAPADYALPSGRVVPLDYETGDRPVLPVRIQELYGQRETPRLG